MSFIVPTMFDPTEKEKRDAGRLARKSAEVLVDRPWTQGTLGDTENGMCILGAMNFTYCGNARPKIFPRLVQVADILFAEWSDTLGMPSFNDALGRTKEEVIETLHKFADEYDPKGKGV